MSSEVSTQTILFPLAIDLRRAVARSTSTTGHDSVIACKTDGQNLLPSTLNQSLLVLGPTTTRLCCSFHDNFSDASFFFTMKADGMQLRPSGHGCKRQQRGGSNRYILGLTCLSPFAYTALWVFGCPSPPTESHGGFAGGLQFGSSQLLLGSALLRICWFTPSSSPSCLSNSSVCHTIRFRRSQGGYYVHTPPGWSCPQSLLPCTRSDIQ